LKSIGYWKAFLIAPEIIKLPPGDNLQKNLHPAGYTAVTTGSGVLRLRSSVTGASAFIFVDKRQSELKIMPDFCPKMLSEEPISNHLVKFQECGLPSTCR